MCPTLFILPGHFGNTGGFRNLTGAGVAHLLLFILKCKIARNFIASITTASKTF